MTTVWPGLPARPDMRGQPRTAISITACRNRGSAQRVRTRPPSESAAGDATARELAADVEPVPDVLARPRHAEKRRPFDRLRLEPVGQLARGALVQIGQHARAQPPAPPTHCALRPLMKATKSRSDVIGPRRRRRHSVAMERQPAQGRVQQVRDHVAHEPRAGDGRPRPVPGGRARNSPTSAPDTGRNIARVSTGVRGSRGIRCS